MKGIAKLYGTLCRELSYALWSFWSIISGFETLTYKVEDEWLPVQGNSHPDSPYYVCVRFYSGRQMPLPFFTSPKAKIGWIQVHAIKLAMKLNPRSYEAAQIACAWYEYEWEYIQQVEAEEQACWNDDDGLLGAMTLARISGN